MSTLLFFTLAAIYLYSFTRIRYPVSLSPSTTPFWFLAGLLIYLPIHYAFKKAIILHIFSHEITHALWSIIFGGKIDEIYISRNRGGFTRYTRGNFLVTLAPYFFPLYTLIFLALALIARENFRTAFVFLCGMSTSFHILLTIYSIKIGQPDLKKEGLAFSLSFIALMNILILVTIFLGLSNPVEIKNFLYSGFIIFKNMSIKLFIYISNTYLNHF